MDLVPIGVAGSEASMSCNLHQAVLFPPSPPGWWRARSSLSAQRISVLSATVALMSVAMRAADGVRLKTTSTAEGAGRVGVCACCVACVQVSAKGNQVLFLIDKRSEGNHPVSYAEV